MPNFLDVTLYCRDQIPLHDLSVIQIQLKHDILGRNITHNAESLFCLVQDIAGHVPGIDRFQHQGDAMFGRLWRDAAQIAFKRG